MVVTPVQAEREAKRVQREVEAEREKVSKPQTLTPTPIPSPTLTLTLTLIPTLTLTPTPTLTPTLSLTLSPNQGLRHMLKLRRHEGRRVVHVSLSIDAAVLASGNPPAVRLAFGQPSP